MKVEQEEGKHFNGSSLLNKDESEHRHIPNIATYLLASLTLELVYKSHFNHFDLSMLTLFVMCK